MSKIEAGTVEKNSSTVSSLAKIGPIRDRFLADDLYSSRFFRNVPGLNLDICLISIRD